MSIYLDAISKRKQTILASTIFERNTFRISRIPFWEQRRYKHIQTFLLPLNKRIVLRVQFRSNARLFLVQSVLFSRWFLLDVWSMFVDKCCGPILWKTYGSWTRMCSYSGSYVYKCSLDVWVCVYLNFQPIFAFLFTFSIHFYSIHFVFLFKLWCSWRIR